MPRKWDPPILNANSVSHYLVSAGFRAHRAGVAGYDVSARPDGSIEIYSFDARGEVLDPDPVMRLWGLRLADVGFTVHVVKKTHLLVTGGRPAASHAVERAA